MEERLGRNIVFPIYNADDTPFHGLVLRKATVDGVVMSLSDKITGECFYKDNTLSFTMKEYVKHNGVKYMLVNPPTVTREGLVSDNSEARGMTKYTFEFYHPMYQLSNLPFSDVATSSNQVRYLSESKKFNWIGKPDDYVAKLNKNLQGTEWVVVKSDRFPDGINDELSEVLQFDNATIADALKKFYDTWGVPYVIDTIEEGEYTYVNEHEEEIDYYSQQGGNKRFVVVLGLPSNEIYRTDLDRQLENPFVFRMGRGVGLKNNSRTPRNNKIVTRIAGYGSEDNIPYGYPQVRWYGDQRWDYTAYKGDTISYDGEGKVLNEPADNAYPLYMGIVGGAYVKLIKHPFTREHLMPSVYSHSLFNKVSPYNPDGTVNTEYDQDTELVDYYDAVRSVEFPYVNEINPLAPSYEIHEFDVKPQMDDGMSETEILGAVPLNEDLTEATAWDDTMDEDGNYLQSYFKVTLPQLSFDIYACAAITQEMQLNMRGGACLGCTFPIQVDWEAYKVNFYDQEGNFLPDGSQRDLTKFPKSNLGSIEVIVQKEYSTFGTIMPNIYQKPKAGDEFVILGISLPLEYISNAEVVLDGEMRSYMLENNVYYYDYPLKFDEYFLARNTDILRQIRQNTIVRFDYAGESMDLFVKQITIKYGIGVLPQYDITLTDNIEVVLNQIGQVADDVERIGSLLSILRQTYSKSVWGELAKKLSKTQDDTARGVITFLQGILFGYQQKWGIDGDGNATLNNINAQEAIFKKLTAQEAHFFTLIIDEIKSVGGQLIITPANCRVDYVKELRTNGNLTGWRCYFKASNTERTINNQWQVGDQAIHVEFNVESGGSKNYWRLVTGVSTDTVLLDLASGEEVSEEYEGLDGVLECHWIELSKSDCKDGSTDPMEGDDVSQLGNRNDQDRQNAIVISAYDIPFIDTDPYMGDERGILAPLYVSYRGIHNYEVGEDNRIAIIAGNGHQFRGRVILEADSQLADGRDVNELGILEGNLIRNSGFTGDYDSMVINDYNDTVNDDTIVFSDPLQYWDAQNVTIDGANTHSVSGSAALVSNGSLSQRIEDGVHPDTWYVLSFKAYVINDTNGTLNVRFGGYSNNVPIGNTPQRKDIPFKATLDEANLVLSTTDNIVLMDLTLVHGNIPTSYKPSEKDNDRTLAEFLGIGYLKKAIYEANTEILGGLVMTALIKVGNYLNGRQENTGGMNGLVNDLNSPFLWGGGTLEQALYTINKYADNVRYVPETEEELAELAKFVVTHGGRAILNDIILRGYIYATGGVFENVRSRDGKWSLDKGGIMRCIDAWISGSMYTPYTIIDNENIGDYATLKEITIHSWRGDIPVSAYTLNLELSGLNIQIDYSSQASLYIALPNDERYVGAELNIFANNPCAVCGVTMIDPNYMTSYTTFNPVLLKGQKIKLKCFNDGGTFRWIADSYSDAVRFRTPIQIACVQVHPFIANDVLKFDETFKNYHSSVGFTYSRRNNDTGIFVVTLPSDWSGITTADLLIIPSTGQGLQGTGGVYSAVIDRTAHSFTVMVADDGSANDGDFGFTLYLNRDKEAVEAAYLINE